MVRAGDPSRRAANFPRFAFPAFVTRLTRAGNRIKAPSPLAGVRVVSIDETANAVLTATDANDDEILHGQRRERDAVALRVIESGHIPSDVPRFSVERDHMRIQRAQEYLVAKNGQAAIHASAAGPNISRQRALILPDRPARARVQREGALVLTRAIQHAVDNQRRRLELSARHGLIGPLRHQPVRVADINLIECAEPMTGIITRVGQPVLRFLRGIEQPLRRHLRPRRAAQKTAHKQSCCLANRILHRLPHLLLALDKYATMSCKSFSGSIFSSYFGISDSRVLLNARSLSFSNR